ncbi:MAG: hypothetical protein ACOYLQ_15330 [Hyphomicrobiaceae bacterium]|jgi:hypothetical protein
MRSRIIALAGLAAAATLFGAVPTFAGDLVRVGRTSEDPYAYTVRVPRYYPYVNSGYWVPRAAMRYRHRYDTVLPPYQSSWGHPVEPRATVWYERGPRPLPVK